MLLHKMTTPFSDQTIIERILEHADRNPENFSAAAKLMESILDYRLNMRRLDLVNMRADPTLNTNTRIFSRSPAPTFHRTSIVDASMNSIVETVIYDNTTFSESRCPISLDDFIPGEEVYRLRTCGHYFKKEPLCEWLMRRRHCPVCRAHVVRQSDNVDMNLMEYLVRSFIIPDMEN